MLLLLVLLLLLLFLLVLLHFIAELALLPHGYRHSIVVGGDGVVAQRQTIATTTAATTPWSQANHWLRLLLDLALDML